MKRPIILILILSLLFTATASYAQDSKPRQGYVYVSGGYIITGIIEERTNGDIIVRTENGEQFEFTKQGDTENKISQGGQKETRN